MPDPAIAPEKPPTPQQQRQMILAFHRANLANVEGTIAQTTDRLSSLPDRSDPRQRRRDEANSNIVAREMQRTMSDPVRFGTWWFAHQATKRARDTYRAAIAKLDKAARDAAKPIRRFLANPTSLNKSAAEDLKAWRDAAAAAEEKRKELNALIFEEEEAARDGHVDCTEDMAEVCVQKSHFKCVLVECDYDDCVCTFSYAGGGEWDPKKQRELREKGKGGAGKDGKDSDKGGGGGRGGHAQAPAPAHYAEGSQGAPGVPKKPASTEPSPRKRPAEVRPEGTTADGSSACRTCADALALVSAMGQASSPAGLEKQIDCLWTAASNTTAAGGGRLTDGLDKDASDRKHLVTELAARCSGRVMMHSKGETAARDGQTVPPAGTPQFPKGAYFQAGPDNGDDDEENQPKEPLPEEAPSPPPGTFRGPRELPLPTPDLTDREPPPPVDIEKVLEDGIEKAAKDLEKGRHQFVSGASPATTPNAEAAPNSKHWTKSGKGIETDDPAAAIEEIFALSGKKDATMDDAFKFDCASAVWVVRYKAILDAIGAVEFNALFHNYIVLNGSASSGSKEANRLYAQEGKKTSANPSLGVDFDGPPYKKGDVHYVGPRGSGENIIRMTGGAMTDESPVFGWGRGRPDHPRGVHPLSAFETAWDGEADVGGSRLNVDAIYAAPKSK